MCPLKKINILFWCFLLVSVLAAQPELGDPGWIFDESLYDDRFPDMKEWAKAGVQGGIPFRSDIPVKRTLSPVTGDNDMSDNIQSAIDAVASEGGGAVLLNEGTYPIRNSITLKSKVILRGTERKSVNIASYMSAPSDSKKSCVIMENISQAGLEDLTLSFVREGVEPIDREHWLDGGWSNDIFQNDPHGVNDLYVRLVYIKSSTNCWIDHCRFIESGTEPLFIKGSYLTLRKNYSDRAYNKGGGGNGYYDLRGDHCLVVKDTVRRIRHFAVQQGAQYNVIFKCHIEVDVNFHNKDEGHNLVEQNKILLPTWHGWDIFATGGPEWGHTPPGPENLILNNTTNYKNQGPRYADKDRIYTFTGYGAPVRLPDAGPSGGTFYAVKYIGTNITNQNKWGNNVIRLGYNSSGSFPTIHLTLHEGGIIRIKLFSVNGRVIHTKSIQCLPGVIETVDLNNSKRLAGGLYYISVEVNGQRKFWQKIIKM